MKVLGFFYRNTNKDENILFCGMHFKNRLGTAAGLDKNGDYIDALGELGFGFLEFEQLLFDHFDLLFLTLHLDTLLFLLRRRQVLVQVLQVVRVATEHSLVIHDVESLAVILLVIVVGVRVVGGRVLELLFLAHHFRLSTLERLSHNFKFINIEADMAF